MTKRKRRPPAKVCGAKKTSGKGTCGHSAGWGTDHPGVGRCKYHGGNTPTHRQAAQRQAAEEAVATYGLPVEVEPVEAIVDNLHRTAGHVRWLADEIAAFEKGDLVYGVYEDTATAAEGGAAVDRKVKRRAVPAVLLKLYQQERKHYLDVARVAVAAGIAEREIRIAEHQAAIFAAALRGILGDLGVADHPDVGKIVRRHFTLIEGGRAGAA